MPTLSPMQKVIRANRTERASCGRPSFSFGFGGLKIATGPRDVSANPATLIRPELRRAPVRTRGDRSRTRAITGPIVARLHGRSRRTFFELD
jgi:hypothetical protein